MPTYRITGPDGKTYQVTAPDGATEAQVLAYVQSNAAQVPERDLTPGLSTNPTDTMGQTERAMAALGGNAQRAVRGVAQLGNETFGGNMPMYIADKLTGGRVGEAMGVPERRSQFQQLEADARQAEAPLMDTKAGQAGNVLGYVLQTLGPGLALRGTAVGNAFLPATIKGATAQGGLLGAIQPTVEGESRGENAAWGAGGGLLGGVIPRLIGTTVRAGARAIEPFTSKGLDNIVGRTIQRFASNPQVQALPDPILGAAPTLAEATLDPGIAQLQRAAAAKSPGVANALFDSRVAANEGRASALEAFAGTPQARQMAMDGISAAEDAAYSAIRPVNGVNVRPVIDQIDNILLGPAGKREAVQSALGKARKALFMDAEQSVSENSVDRLLGARGAINDLLAGGGENQSGKLAQRELISVREALDAAIRKAAPRIDEALDARRVGMQPVNEMDTVTALLQKATVPVPTRTGGMGRSLQPSAFLRPTEDLDKLARQGTGFRRAEADNVLSPPAQDAIEGVRVGLARQQFADSAGKVAGSPTAQFLAGGNIMDAVGGKPGGLLSGVMDSVSAGLDKPYALLGVPQRLEAVMAQVLTDPVKAQAILARLPSPDRALLEQAIGRLTAPASAGAVVSLSQ